MIDDKEIFTSVDFKYGNENWNPIVDTQFTEKKGGISKFEESYIFGHQELWAELSKH